MIYRTLTLAAAAIMCTSAALADGHAKLKGYAIAGNGKTLVTMKSLGKPGDVSTFDLANKVNAIAYRPVTGDLLGFSSTGAVYSIDPASGKMKDLAAKFADEATIGDVVAFDFNNKIDAVRAVGKDGTNLVYFPGNFGDDRAGKVLRFTDTHYVDGDANTGKTPAIFANAYTNAIAGSKAGSTFQYALDAETNALVSLANNAGKLQTVGKVMIDGKPVDLAAAGGFDIVSEKEGTDAAFAVLQLEGAKTAGLYSVNLQSAEATLLADLGIGGVSGFAASGAR